MLNRLHLLQTLLLRLLLELGVLHTQHAGSDTLTADLRQLHSIPRMTHTHTHTQTEREGLPNTTHTATELLNTSTPHTHFLQQTDSYSAFLI